MTAKPGPRLTRPRRSKPHLDRPAAPCLAATGHTVPSRDRHAYPNRDQRKNRQPSRGFGAEESAIVSGYIWLRPEAHFNTLYPTMDFQNRPRIPKEFQNHSLGVSTVRSNAWLQCRQTLLRWRLPFCTMYELSTRQSLQPQRGQAHGSSAASAAISCNDLGFFLSSVIAPPFPPGSWASWLVLRQRGSEISETRQHQHGPAPRHPGNGLARSAVRTSPSSRPIVR